MEAIKEILDQDNNVDIFSKLQAFYRAEFDIGFVEETPHNGYEPTLALYINHYNKINAKHIGIPQTITPRHLDLTELQKILDCHLKPIIAPLNMQSLLDLQTLIQKKINALDKSNSDENQQILYFLSALSVRVTLNLQRKLQPQILSILELSQLLTQLETNIASLKPAQFNHHLKNIEEFITAMSEHTLFDTGANPGLHVLIENKKFCDAVMELQCCVPILDHAIKHTLSNLLQTYKKDVLRSISAPDKKEKLEFIDTSLLLFYDKLTTTELLSEIKILFNANPELHQTIPLGRYIYNCICELLGLQPSQNDANFKLADALLDDALPKKPSPF